MLRAFNLSAPTSLFLAASWFVLSVSSEELPTPLPSPPDARTFSTFERLPPVLFSVPAPARSQAGSLDINDLEMAPDEPEVLSEPELTTERYPTREIKLQRYVIQDADRNYVNHGQWTMMSPKGEVIAQGEYRYGKRHGPWMRVLEAFPTADPEFKAPFVSQAEFQDGELHGSWTIIDARQRVVGTWQFSQGELDGVCTTWYPNGQQRREMAFAKGVPDGEARAWKADGTLWSKEFFREGKQLMPVITWHDDQQKESEGWMVRSDFTIHTNVDWWEGVLEIRRQDSTAEDVKTGEWTEWYANGSIHYRGSYDQGEPVGQHVRYHENGQRMEMGRYEAGLADGRWTRWHVNGQKQEEGIYLAGSKTGTWTTWAEDGQVADARDLSDQSRLVRSDDRSTMPSHNVSHILSRE